MTSLCQRWHNQTPAMWPPGECWDLRASAGLTNAAWHNVRIMNCLFFKKKIPRGKRRILKTITLKCTLNIFMTHFFPASRKAVFTGHRSPSARALCPRLAGCGHPRDVCAGEGGRHQRSRAREVILPLSSGCVWVSFPSHGRSEHSSQTNNLQPQYWSFFNSLIFHFTLDVTPGSFRY